LLLPPDCENYYECPPERFEFIGLQNSDRPNSIASNDIYTIEEVDQSLWIGTTRGLSILNLEQFSDLDKLEEFRAHPEQVRFDTHEDKNRGIDKVKYDLITRIYRDDIGITWIATDNGFVTYHKHIQRIPIELNTIYQQDTVEIIGFLRRRNEDLWISTFQDEILTYDEASGQSKLMVFDGSKQIHLEDPRTFLEVESGRIWIGAENGLFYYEPSTNTLSQFERALLDKKTIIRHLYKDSKGRIWILSVNEGIFILEKNGTLRSFRQDIYKPNSLSSSSVWDIQEDQFGNFWLATNGGGINKINIDEDGKYHFQSFFDPHGNTNRSLNNINALEVIDDYLWMSTPNTLLKYNIPKDSFVYFDYLDEKISSVYGLYPDADKNL
ncbi:MAG: two-component regulator propeller domain-containing protein, partial [Bacteroidota bacterium]